MRVKFKKPLVISFLLACLGGCQLDIPQRFQEKPQTVEVPAYAPAPVNAGQGAALFCKVGHGIAVFNHGWHDFADTIFTLRANEKVNVNLSRLDQHGTITIQGFFDAPGQKLIFCPYVDGPPQQRIACTSIYALDDDLHQGLKRTFDIPQVVRSGAITCAFEQAKLKPLTGE